MLTRLALSLPVSLIHMGLIGCSSSLTESKPQIAFGTPHDMGDAELSYSVLVLGKHSGCSGTAIGPRHVITSTDCLGAYEGLPENKIEVVSFAGRTPEFIKASKAVRHPREDLVWRQPFSLTNIASSNVALILLERPMATEGITIAKPTLTLSQELKITGFGSNENNTTNGRPRSARSKPGWSGTSFESNYGIVGFVKGDGAPCSGDVGAPAVSGEKLVGIVSSFQGRLNECEKTEFALLMDARLMRGWLKCTAQQLGHPLSQLSDASEDPWCRDNVVKIFNQ